ncbi:MAG: ABC transporter ATP-binding protein [Gammaproteobacteria bacterium]|nr:ABC transporter ATP-binding protein [Gammaproteobacteria bacterium]
MPGSRNNFKNSHQPAPEIVINDLSYHYPGSTQKVLQDIRLTINKGTVLGLIGPNGAGKTTLISLLTGILKHTNGTMTLGGYSLPQFTKQAKRLIGYIPQDYAFYPNLTAVENLQFFAGVQGITSAKRQLRIEYCLEFCQLQKVLQQKVAEFSGGLKRRLNIAIGLLNDPEILFFDEPTVSIDPQSRAFILQQIKVLQSQGKTIIYTSHYMEEVEQLCDYLAIIDQGTILKQGTLQSLQQEQQQQLIIVFKKTIDEYSLKHLKTRFKFSIHQTQLVFHNVANMAIYNQIIEQVQKMNLPITSIFYGKHNLEQIFLDLTSKKLRD